MIDVFWFIMMHSLVGTAGNDGIYDLRAIEFRVLLKLMLHCENDALQKMVEYSNPRGFLNNEIYYYYHENDMCADTHDDRIGATSEARCLALSGCMYNAAKDHCYTATSDGEDTGQSLNCGSAMKANAAIVTQLLTAIDGDCMPHAEQLKILAGKSSPRSQRRVRCDRARLTVVLLNAVFMYTDSLLLKKVRIRPLSCCCDATTPADDAMFALLATKKHGGFPDGTPVEGELDLVIDMATVMEEVFAEETGKQVPTLAAAVQAS